MRYLLGIDIGSSSVKAALLDIDSGRSVASAFSPDSEMTISAPHPGFAEQHPDSWWRELSSALDRLRTRRAFSGEEVAAIGISYQMHGLVVVDSEGRPLRDSIIWCDSRAVGIGNAAFEALGEGFCLSHYLNSPGNFTASKLGWVRENEPEIYARIHKAMLPGDYISYRLTGKMATTVSGLSEGIFWDYLSEGPALELLTHYQIDPSLLPDLVPQFGEQGRLTDEAARALGLKAGTPVTYRAGDQPNNAYSLKVLEPGEVAATAGTSGVVYGVTDRPEYDAASRVNAFVHVNHTQAASRYGVLLCINGTGILNSWLRRNVFHGVGYDEMNDLAGSVSIGSDGLRLYPFGNGAERVLGNLDTGSFMEELHFNRHGAAHMARAAQEGIVFAMQYGMDVMRAMGMDLRTVRAGHANMFLSPVFSKAFADVTGCLLELYDTDGAQGAARGAGVGAGLYTSAVASHAGLDIIRVQEPDAKSTAAYADAYAVWKDGLLRRIG
jgi:xylulokinase